MQYKLRPLEAICVAGSVQDCLDRLTVLQSLTPSVVTQRDELSNILGKTVAQIIKKQKETEAQYEALVKTRSELKSLSNKTRYKKNQEDIENKAKELKELTHELCKHLRESPNVTQNLQKIQEERSALITLFTGFHEELLQMYSFNGIAKWTIDKTQEFDRMMRIMQNDSEMNEEITRLNKSIRETTDSMNSKLKELDEEIKKQKIELQRLQSRIADLKANHSDEKNAKDAALRNMANLRHKEISNKVIEANRQLQNEKNVHNVTKEYFDRRMSVISSKIKEWETKYSNDTKSQQDKLETLTSHVNENKRLINLKTPEKEENARLMKLEQERSWNRAEQLEIRHAQTRAMNRLKVAFLLHSKIRGPLPKPKGKKGKKGKKWNNCY